LRDELARRLDSLQRQGLITAWHDRRIIAGTDWAQTIDEHLNTASIILLLISPHFLASRYCSEIEMPQALKRHTAGEARVVPILLSSLDFNWTHEPFARLQVLPTGGKPITEWKDQNKAFLDVMRGIRRAAEEWIGSSSEDASEHIWHIPYRQNSFFTGQENILSSLYNELEEHVAANLTQPQAISGLGGIGKTQIAIEYAYRFRDKYRVILWCLRYVVCDPPHPQKLMKRSTHQRENGGNGVW
jgi:TIR domain